LCLAQPVVPPAAYDAGVFQRTIWWGGHDHVVVIDQTRLPHVATTVEWRTLDDAVTGIAEMQVRGAPLIGVAAAHGVALALLADPTALDEAIARLAATRPTAVNLAWALSRVRAELDPLPPIERAAAARRLATRLADEDAAACRAIGEAGVVLLDDIHQRTGRPVQVLTHCNAGWLACVEWGTATARCRRRVPATRARR
jgi:methylthioribose-1-phosphate isomerase